MTIMDALEKARLAAQAADEKLATDIVIIEVGKQLGITDYFVMVTGNNDRQVAAIAEAIEKKFSQSDIKKRQVEKTEEKTWILLDYYDVIVHIMQPETRNFYNIEKLWQDCPQELYK